MIDILQGNCLEVLKDLPTQTFHTVVTSPPYWGLRDYQTGIWVGGDSNCKHMRTTKIGKNVKTTTGHQSMHEQGNVVGDAIYKSVCPKCGAKRKDFQLGLENTPKEYVDNLVKVFREVKKVLRDDGTVWLNLGDTYCSSRPKGTSGNSNNVGNAYKKHMEKEFDFGRIGKTSILKTNQHRGRGKIVDGFKEKDLIGIPWRVAFALQEDGWYLRQDIIWNKPNPMPESVQDRCTKAHEYIFLLSKNAKYYYDNDAIKEHNQNSYEKRNKRSVWTVSPKPFHQAHFAVYPTELITPCILAGCPEGGHVLDPFGGAGTTAVVADRHKRNATIIELNKDYVEIAKNRLQNDAPLFTEVNIKKT